jgi:putative endonuclease
MADNLEFGKKGEELAAAFLRKKGYEILETNWRYGKNEVDIIARDSAGKCIVIVEVKSRRSTYGGEPETAVNREKQRALIRAANAYVNSKKIQEEIRFDIVSIVVKAGAEKIDHIVDAFYPTLQGGKY